MGDNSKIEWTDASWNVAVGCTKVSPGCDFCYAERITNRFGGPGAFDTVAIRPDRLALPLRWKRPRRIFVNSMSDLFHDEIPDEIIAQQFAVMALAPQHQFQVLTKRHGRMRSLLGSPRFARLMERVFAITFLDEDLIPLPEDAPMPASVYDPASRWANSAESPTAVLPPLPNVHLGVSVESQQWADVRIPALLDTPAAVRFLSCEPLLGPVGLTKWLHGGFGRAGDFGDLHWVIAGGESGPAARPMHPDWARSLRDECVAAGVAFHFKQFGEWREDVYVDEDGVTHWAGRKPEPSDPRRLALHLAGMTALTKDNPFDPFDLGHPGWTVMRRTKHKSERDLDGRTWDEYPTSSPTRQGSPVRLD